MLTNLSSKEVALLFGWICSFEALNDNVDVSWGLFGAELGASTCRLSSLFSLFFNVSQKTLVLKITLIPLLPRAFFGFNFFRSDSIFFSLQRL